MRIPQRLIGILFAALLLAGCIFASVFADDTSSAPNNWGGDMMGLTEAKAHVDALLEDGPILPEIRIAVIDTGVNADHELFSGRILSESRSFINQNTSDYSDENGHGTHVAGNIAQNTPTNVKILVLQALDKNKKGEANDVANAIEYAVAQGADIINLSLGVSKAAGAQADPDDPDETMGDDEYRAYVATISDAIDRAKSSGCLIIAAAGNSAGGRDLAESQTYPAISDDVITVSAISEDKSLYENSNYGEAVDFCAPGEDIYSAGIDSDTALEPLSGTSMAAPFISSAFAMLRLYNPELNANNLISKMQSSDITQDIGAEGKDPQYGYGLPVFEEGNVPHTKLSGPEIKKTTSDGETITLEWDAVNYLTYDVYRRESGTEEFACVASGLSDGQFVDEDVVLRTTYDYYLEAPSGILFLEAVCSDTVSVKAYVDVMEVSCPYDKNRYLKPGNQYQLAIRVYPSNATDKDFVCKSENEEIATVDGSGLVTAINPGIVDIRVGTPDWSKQDKCTFHILDPANNKCGEDATWDIDVIDDETVLTISGTGDIYDYEYSAVPWFSERNNITMVVISDGISRIGSYVFHEMGNLHSVEGMKDVVSIGSEAFSFCDSLEQIELKDRLEIIESHAFKGSALKSISFGSGLITLGNGAFSNCRFKNLTLPAGLEDTGIATFERNQFLQSVTFSEGLRLINQNAFQNCYSLSEVALPTSLESLSAGCFANTALSEVYIPDNVSSVSLTCFEYTNLQSIIVGEQNPYFCSEDGVLFNKEKTVLVLFPYKRGGEYAVPNSVCEIGSNAFSRNMTITKVELPNGIVTLNDSAFEGCTSLKNIELPRSLKAIKSRALLSTGIVEFKWPSPDTTIHGTAFRSCQQLRAVYIPSYVTGMGDKAPKYYFSGCDNISDVYYEGFTKQFYEIKNIDKETNLIKDDVTLHIRASGTAGDGIKWKTEGVSGDVTLTISGSGAMPDYADPKDAPWYDGKDEITHVVIEDGVEKVGRNSFFRYNKIQDVTLPGSVQEFGRDAFRSCNELKTFIYKPEGSSEEYRIELQYLVALYSGSAIEPGAYVSKDGTELKEETDYTLSYKDNTQIGQAAIEVNFIGDHAGKGTVRIPFTITDKLLEGEIVKELISITLDHYSYNYDGSVRKPTAAVKSAGSWELRENADYKLDYSVGRKDPGVYTVVATGIGAYTGSVSATFEILPEEDQGSGDSDNGQADSDDPGSKDSGSDSSGGKSGGNGSGEKQSESKSSDSNKSSGKSTSNTTASTTHASTGTPASGTPAGTGTSTGAGTPSTNSTGTTGNSSAGNTGSDGTSSSSSGQNDEDEDDLSDSDDDFAEEDTYTEQDNDDAAETSVDEESVLPDIVKYIAAGLFLAAAAAGTVFLILMLKKKKKKAA